MKQILLGTSALLGVGLLAGTAQASEGVKLSLGGYFTNQFGVAVDDDNAGEIGDNHNLVGVGTDAEIYFLGSVTLDNGITVGARFDLEGGDEDNDQIDQAYAYFRGSFGDFRIGSQAGAAVNMYMLPPGSTANFGPYSPNTTGAAVVTTGFFDPEGSLTIKDKSQKLVYYSPNWSGFSFGLSFTPNDNEKDYNGDDNADGSFRAISNPGDSDNNFGIGAHYDYEGNGWGLAVGGAAYFEGEIQDKNAADDEQSGYNLGINVNFGGFTIGAAGTYLVDGPDGLKDDLWVIGLGGSYEVEAWTFGLGWAHVDAPTAAVDNDDNKVDRYALTASYAMAPGIDLDAALAYTRVESANDVDGFDDYDALEISVGSSIKF